MDSQGCYYNSDPLFLFLLGQNQARDRARGREDLPLGAGRCSHGRPPGAATRFSDRLRNDKSTPATFFGRALGQVALTHVSKVGESR